MLMLFKILLILLLATPVYAGLPPTRILDEGTDQGLFFKLDCTGAGITCTQSGITGTLAVSGVAAGSGILQIQIDTPPELRDMIVFSTGTGPAVFNTGATMTSLTVETELTATDLIDVEDMKHEDHGDVNYTTGSAVVEDDSHAHVLANIDEISGGVGDEDLVSEDFGDFTCAGEDACTLDTSSVADNEIDYTAVTCADLTMTDCGNVTVGASNALTIPQGSGPTVDAAGEIAVDTSDDQFAYYGGAKRILSYKNYKSFHVEDPVAGDIFQLWKTLDGITITDIECIADPAGSGDTCGVHLRECDSTADNCTEVEPAITCDNDGGADDGSIDNGSIDANDWMTVGILSNEGSVTQLTVTIYYTLDAE